MTPRSSTFPFLYITIFSRFCYGFSENQAHPPDNSWDPALRLAIVGAGVAGASAAFHVHQLSRLTPISITIYDREPIVGGRVMSVRVPEGNPTIVEAGAPCFFVDDDCLTGRMESARLTFPDSTPWELPKSVGLWDGQSVITRPSCNLESPSWKQLVHLIARYGISAWRFHRTIVSISKRWKMFGALPPFDNISHGLKDAGLTDDIAFGSAKTYLQKTGISLKFITEVVEPCIRARFSQDLVTTNVFSALMAARRVENSIFKGNSRLIESMINLSKADLQLNSTVVEIRDGDARQYRLSAISKSSIVHTEYDIIIIALPFHEGRIHLNVSQLWTRPTGDSVELRSYAESHVTHISTSATISPAFFNVSLNASMPDDLLTTAQSTNILSTSRADICYVRYCNPGPELAECDECDDDDNMYRVVSRSPLSDIDLANLIGKQLRDGQNLADVDITWVHRQAWPHGLPILDGNINHGEMGNIEIAPKLFYLGGMERVLPSMETSCRMGRNVARLLTTSVVDEMDAAHLEL